MKQFLFFISEFCFYEKTRISFEKNLEVRILIFLFLFYFLFVLNILFVLNLFFIREFSFLFDNLIFYSCTKLFIPIKQLFIPF